MPSITIRRATPDEATTLTALAHRAKAHWGYSAEWIAAWRDELTITSEYIQAHDVWVADEDGRRLGICALERGDVAWTLEHVWVEPESTGRGVGRALVLHALAHVDSVSPMDVDVVSDPHATSFYEKLGCVRTGTIPAPMPGAPDRCLVKLRWSTAASASSVWG